MIDKPAIRAEATRLQQAFIKAGATPVEADILLPADTLLDLYGEDIRARSYVTADPLLGERMLRPDFTVPVVLTHLADGQAEARYTYAGEVFRRQEEDAARPSEYIQVGFEMMGGADPASDDATVFALFSEILAPLHLRAATGDIGLLMAAVAGLTTTDRRKSALLRHIWRPKRFRRLLERFSDQRPAPARALLNFADPAADAPMIGLRTESEVSDRINALREDAETPPLDARQVALLLDILALKDRAPAALTRLREIAKEMPSIAPAVDRIEARLRAIGAQGVDPEALDFEASYGRTSLEYYDGFVFGFYAEGPSERPPVATGGRYDALTKVLNHGHAIPAIGGIIRPERALAIGGAA